MCDGDIDILAIQENDSIKSNNILQQALSQSEYGIVASENLAILYNYEKGNTPLTQRYFRFDGYKSNYRYSDKYPHGALITNFIFNYGKNGKCFTTIANVHLHSGIGEIHSNARARELIQVESEMSKFSNEYYRDSSHSLDIVQGDFNTMSSAERYRNNLILRHFTNITDHLSHTHDPIRMEPTSLSHCELILLCKALMLINKKNKTPFSKSLDAIYFRSRLKNGIYSADSFVDSNSGSDHYLVGAQINFNY